MRVCLFDGVVEVDVGANKMTHEGLAAHCPQQKLMLPVNVLSLMLYPGVASAFNLPDAPSRPASAHGSFAKLQIVRETNVASRRNVLESVFIGTQFLLTSPIIAIAATRDPKTGILLPSQGEIESSIPKEWDENDNPFSSLDKSSLSRLDSSPDTIFYTEPRFVEHVDAQAVESMTSYISDRLLHPGDSVLDLCSSWTSHLRPTSPLKLKRMAGLGMNAKELEAK